MQSQNSKVGKAGLKGEMPGLRLLVTSVLLGKGNGRQDISILPVKSSLSISAFPLYISIPHAGAPSSLPSKLLH